MSVETDLERALHGVAEGLTTPSTTLAGVRQRARRRRMAIRVAGAAAVVAAVMAAIPLAASLVTDPSSPLIENPADVAGPTGETEPADGTTGDSVEAGEVPPIEGPESPVPESSETPGAEEDPASEYDEITSFVDAWSREDADGMRRWSTPAYDVERALALGVPTTAPYDCAPHQNPGQRQCLVDLDGTTYPVYVLADQSATGEWLVSWVGPYHGQG